MHGSHQFLTALTTVLCVAAVTTVLFQRLRQPVVLGYMLAGLIVGPHVPIPLVADPRIVADAVRAGRHPADVLARARVQPAQAARASAPTAGVDRDRAVQPDGLARLPDRALRSAGRRVESLFAGARRSRSPAPRSSPRRSTSRACAASLREIVVGDPDRRGPDRDPAHRGADRDRDRAAACRRARWRRPSAGWPRSWSGCWSSGCSSCRARSAPSSRIEPARDHAGRQRRHLLRASRCWRARSATRWRSAPSSPARWSPSRARTKTDRAPGPAGARHVRRDLLRLGRHADRSGAGRAPLAGDRGAHASWSSWARSSASRSARS